MNKTAEELNEMLRKIALTMSSVSLPNVFGAKPQDYADRLYEADKARYFEEKRALEQSSKLYKKEQDHE